MPPNFLTAEAQRENAAALAAALGVGVDHAAEALDLEIVITSDATNPVARHIAGEIFALLSRTVRSVTAEPSSGGGSAELIVGSTSARTSAPKLYLGVRDNRAVISQHPDLTAVDVATPRLLGLLTACYGSAAILHLALGGVLPFGAPEPLIVNFNELGVDLTALGKPIDLEHAYLVGAGAIGNGFLWAARHLDLRGRLEIVDDDQVSSGNLNRQVWFDTDDIGLPKVERLASKAQPCLSNLALIPRHYRLQDLPEKSDGPWLRRLIVAVDSRRARRQLQNEFPREVFDASTTDIREVVLHHHVQPTVDACLSCIYEPDAEEFSREQHIADHMGVSIEDVRSERISEAAAHTIAARYASLAVPSLVGTAYDTLFKRLCGEGQLQTTTGRAIVAPFAFVSVLAGTLLALEIVRWLGGGSSAKDFNYWRVSPWHPFFARRRILRPRQRGCAFCGNPVLAAVNRALWS